MADRQKAGADRLKSMARMLDDIRADTRQTENFTGFKSLSDRVMTAMAEVPRHQFMGPGEQVAAYVNRPQPIGFGQTISQPFIVALMTEMLNVSAADTVLEIGTGCGYQAAILAKLCRRVCSVETIEALADQARQRLARLGYDNIDVRHGDGFAGWAESAPFDAIIVTAAPEKIPPALCDQLKPGGRMVIPVGPVHGHQVLKVGHKDKAGKMRFTSTLPVAFVPMVPGRNLNA